MIKIGEVDQLSVSAASNNHQIDQVKQEEPLKLEQAISLDSNGSGFTFLKDRIEALQAIKREQGIEALAADCGVSAALGLFAAGAAVYGGAKTIYDNWVKNSENLI